MHGAPLPTLQPQSDIRQNCRGPVVSAALKTALFGARKGPSLRSTNQRFDRALHRIITEQEADMALNGVLRPGYIQIRVTDLDTALKHYA